MVSFMQQDWGTEEERGGHELHTDKRFIVRSDENKVTAKVDRLRLRG